MAPVHLATPPPLPILDLARLSYAHAYRLQSEHLDRVVASRETTAPSRGIILLVEHDPVITVTRRPNAPSHILATPDALADAGVELAHTDRGGDVTYHGPGQLVVYPIIDLNAHALRIVDYIRLLEAAIIDALGTVGLRANADPAATGVWVNQPAPHAPAKIAAIGVRVRGWVSMHGLSINVAPDMTHFNLIVPCGLHARSVTSLKQELGDRCPTMSVVKHAVVGALRSRLDQRWRPPASTEPSSTS